MVKRADSSRSTLLSDARSWWCVLASGIARHRSGESIDDVATAARALLHVLAFLRLADSLGAFRRELLADLLDARHTLVAETLGNRLRQHFGAWSFLASDDSPPPWLSMLVAADAISAVCDRLWQDDRLRYAWEGHNDLLGQLHQHLLGQRLVQRGQRLIAESSASARKRAGVFYTPTSVTNYIVEQAIDLHRHEPAATDSADGYPSVLDPACGCGAFLLRALSKLLEVRRPRSTIDGVSPIACLHGVDLDPEAAVICRRSLWLACARATSCDTAADASKHLAENIRCGDVLLDASLAGPNEAFDVVIGNPPYRRELNTKHLLDPVAQTDLGRRYRSPRMDYWYYFLHRGLQWLKPGGRLAFIVGAYWTSASGARKLIQQIQQAAHVEEIFALGDTPIFDGVTGRHLILTVRRSAATSPTRVKRPSTGRTASIDALLSDQTAVETFEKSAEQLFRGSWIDLEPPADALLDKIAKGTPLDQFGRVRQGIAENPASINRSTNERFANRWTVGEGVFALREHELSQLALSETERSLLRPYYDLCDLGRYYLAEQPSLHLIYSTSRTWPTLEQCPVLAAHLARFRPILDGRRETRHGVRAWWQLHWPREEALWEADKVLSVQMGSRPAFVPTTGPAYVPFSVNVFVPDKGVREHLYYFAAMLNSRLIWKWFQHHAKRRGAGLEINVRVLAQTPIHRIDFGNATESDSHAQLVHLVGQMLAARRALQTASNAAVADSRRNRLASLDAEIDQIVSRLYGLSRDEIRLLTRSTPPGT